jgi:3-hydroxy-9,10-secoandrosta-1,3,5(10)-triene-9,17-dione monooxygenase reductase component
MALHCPVMWPSSTIGRERGSVAGLGRSAKFYGKVLMRVETVEASEATIEPSYFRDVLASYPTGVCAITSQLPDGRPLGMTVGSFTSASLEPPLVGFLPAKSSGTWPRIQAIGFFCVNVLASDQQDVCRQLATRGEHKFTDVRHAPSESGMPLLHDALAYIECELHSVTDAGDHWFVLGLVRSLRRARTANALLFFQGKYGSFAELG